MAKRTRTNTDLLEHGQTSCNWQSGSFKPRHVHMNSLIERTLGGFRRKLPSSMNMTFVSRATPDSISADVEQMQRVIELLLQNAIESNENYGGEIFVTTSNTILNVMHSNGIQSLVSQPYVVITIRDDGPPMDENEVRHLFDPVDTEDEPGRRLDLSIVDTVVKRHDGLIEVASTPERGTVVRLLLPEKEIP